MYVVVISLTLSTQKNSTRFSEKGDGEGVLRGGSKMDKTHFIKLIHILMKKTKQTKSKKLEKIGDALKHFIFTFVKDNKVRLWNN